MNDERYGIRFQPDARRAITERLPESIAVLQDPVDDTGPVEPGRDREAPGPGRWLEPADLLYPPDVQLQMRALGGARIAEAALDAAEEFVRSVLGRRPEAEEREVVAAAGEAGGDSSPVALDVNKFYEIFIS